MNEEYAEFKYQGAQLRLHLPTVTLKAYYSSSNPTDVARVFSTEGVQPQKDVQLVAGALLFAAKAHASIDHRRKYTNEPYVVHPIAVANIVKSVPHTPEMVAAALLHDVVEECAVFHGDVSEAFGEAVGKLVYWLTDFSMPMDGNRARRKEIDRRFISGAPPEAKTIKLADLIDNTRTIKERDPDFWRVYRHEKLRLLDVLRDGDRTLWARAAAQCEMEMA